MKYYEDFPPGTLIECGSRVVSKDEIIRFAREYDPQLFHLDEAAAAKTHFGGLVASGWHSGSIAMRMVVDTVMHDSSCMGSPGIERLRWLKPLRADTCVTVKFRVLEADLSKSRPDRGRLKVVFELYDDQGELLMDSIAIVLFGCRPK
ncbi:MAG: MaoC family dehydratase [Betaproteobacteria bacterium]|nr:MaoC family dehydratase [Betaproteobacteria bacterium]